jgi:DNA-binding PadR family transcriptional regulator
MHRRIEPESPLTPAVFHILVALTGRELHGYGIMQEVAERTSEKFLMGPGTLYGTLKRMLEAGLVEEAGEHSDPQSNERRRYYRITGKGRRAAVAEAARLEVLVHAARAAGLMQRLRPAQEGR